MGTTLGRYFAEHSVEVAGYYSRSISSASEAAAFTGSRVFETARDVLAASDVLFLTVPDGAIRTVYDALPKELLRGKILCPAALSIHSSRSATKTLTANSWMFFLRSKALPRACRG